MKIVQLFLLAMIMVLAQSVYAAEKPKLMDNLVAVFDFDADSVDKSISRPITDSIRREIVKSNKYEVIDRSNMDKILGEQKFQYSGCVAGKCVIQAGQLLGVGKIITGSVNKIGQTFYLSMQLVNVETGKIEEVSEDKCKCEIEDLLDSSKRLVRRMLGEKVVDTEFAKQAKFDVNKLKKVLGNWFGGFLILYDRAKNQSYLMAKNYMQLTIKLVNDEIIVSSQFKNISFDNIKLEDDKLLFNLAYSDGTYNFTDKYNISTSQKKVDELEITFVRDKHPLNTKGDVLLNAEGKMTLTKCKTFKVATDSNFVCNNEEHKIK